MCICARCLVLKLLCSKLGKEDLIRITLKMQDEKDSALANINKKLTEIRKNYNKIEANLAVSKSIAEAMN